MNVGDRTGDEPRRRERNAAFLRGVYAIVEPERRPLLPYVGELLAGGIRLFQIRAKRGIDAHLLNAAVAAVRAAGGLILVNDDVDAALAADGVHLGQEDAARHDFVALRRRLGSRVMGLSCGTPGEARAADPGIVDYLGIGPLFETGSKADAGPPIGVDGMRAVVAVTNLPTAAIGGITLPSIPAVRASGATMAAVISALASAPDAREQARAFVAAWNA
jgi:thiamine-phosphate diphosphorylase